MQFYDTEYLLWKISGTNLAQAIIWIDEGKMEHGEGGILKRQFHFLKERSEAGVTLLIRTVQTDVLLVN